MIAATDRRITEIIELMTEFRTKPVRGGRAHQVYSAHTGAEIGEPYATEDMAKAGARRHAATRIAALFEGGAT